MTLIHEILPLLTVALLLELLLVLFYFGQMLHSNLINLSELIYQSDWYQYPRSVQRFVRLMIMRAQKQFYISAYGILSCHLENFAGVSQKFFKCN